MIFCHACAGADSLQLPTDVTRAGEIEVDILSGFGNEVVPAVPRYDLRIRLANPHSLPKSISLIQQSSARLELGEFARLWIDIGEAPVGDWLAFRRVWEFFCRETARYAPTSQGIGIAAAALIMPGASAGYLSAEYLDQISQPLLFGRKLWAGIPVNPRYTEWYLSKSHFVKGAKSTVFQTFKALGIEVQAELLRFAEPAWDALDDLPVVDRAERGRQFLGLLHSFEAVRFAEEDLPLVRLLPANETGPSGGAGASPAHTPDAPCFPRQVFVKEPQVLVSREMNHLYQSTAINHLELVELMLLIEGHKKAVRTTGSRRRVESIRLLAESFGLHWTISTFQTQFRKDRGKGGWTNLYHYHPLTARRVPQYLIYLAKSQAIAEEAIRCETADDESFGEILGYPECCRNAFTRNFATSLGKQGDLVPIVADQTASTAPWPFLLNIPARYFEECLISFYPCAYTCPNALKVAAETYQMIGHYLPDYELSLHRIFSSAVLYTEYRGVYLFPGGKLDGDCVCYDPAEMMMTISNRVGLMLKRGNRMLISAPDHITVLHNGVTLGTLKGENVRFMVFGGDNDFQ